MQQLHTLCVRCVYPRGKSVPRHRQRNTHSWAAGWLWLTGTSAGLNTASLSLCRGKPRCAGWTQRNTTKSSLVGLSTVCTQPAEWRTQTSTGAGGAPTHAKPSLLEKRARELSKPLQLQLWTVSDQPLDKQAGADLHRLSRPQKSSRRFRQTFTTVWSRMKEKEWNKTDNECNLTRHNTEKKTLVEQISVISRCFCGGSWAAVELQKC